MFIPRKQLGRIIESVMTSQFNSLNLKIDFYNILLFLPKMLLENNIEIRTRYNS